MSATVQQETPARAGTVTAQAVTALFRAPAFAAFWRSRLLIWIVGVSAFLIYGPARRITPISDPEHLTKSFGALGNILASPAVRWDSIWYLDLAHHGYRTLQDTGFFPLYPLLIRAGSSVLRSPVLAALTISMLATLAGLALLYRLSELELGPRAARTTVTLMAFAPFAFYLSAVYTEGLFLAFSVGTFYAARRGRWACAGILGGLAALTRVTGVLLIIPVLLLFLYGPREATRPAPPLPEHDGQDRGDRARRLLLNLRPRYPLTPALLWSLLIPAGLAAFCGYTAIKGFGLRATFHAQQLYWQHDFQWPLTDIWRGITLSWHQLSDQFTATQADIFRTAEVLQVLAVVLSAAAVVGVFRRLPFPFGVYVVLGLLIPLSTPTVGDPLKGMMRYASMMFPLFMWAGAWASTTRRKLSLLGASVPLLIAFTAQFATWHVVGSLPG